MLNNAHHHVIVVDDREQAWLESLVRDDFDACHPGDSLDDVKRRARFSKEDKGLLREWMVIAANRAAAATPACAEAAE